MSTSWEDADDDTLLAELAAVLRDRTEPPRDVVEAAKGLFTWRMVDAEIAALTFDSLLDDEPAVVRSTEAPPRTLTFEVDGLVVEVEIDADDGAERRLMGQLVPARLGEVELVTATQTIRAPVDDLGCFAVSFPAGPPQSVTLRFTMDGGRVVAVVMTI